jgi:hypothetical protein
MSDHTEQDDEVERLKAEAGQLRAQQQAGQAGQPAARGKRGGRWRAPLAITLLVLGSILAPVAVLGFWASNEVTNTNRFVENMSPLITEPAVQSALTDKISDAIINEANVQGLVTSASGELSSRGLTRLSTLLNGFSGQIYSTVDGFIHSAVARVVASPAMATIWTQALRAAHASLVKVLSGQGGGAVNVTDDKVTISLGPLITQAKTDLSARGLSFVSKLPSVNPTFTLFEAKNLSKAQSGYRLVSTLKWALPFLSLGLLAAGVLVARSRRRALCGAGIGLAASMLVLGLALAIARLIYLRDVPASTLPADAAAALYDTLVRFIRESLRALLVAGLVIAAGAYLTGPARGAVWVRRTVSSWMGWLADRGPRTGPVGKFVAAHKTGLRISVVALAALIFAFSIPPTVALVIWLVVVLLVLLALIEILGGGNRRRVTPAPPAPRAPA